jgi:hypothetical protein
MSSFRDFINKVLSLPGIEEKNTYFSQMRDGYAAAYKPLFPKSSEKDFIIQTIDQSGAYLRGNYELIAFDGSKVTSFYFEDFDNLKEHITRINNKRNNRPPYSGNCVEAK